LVSLICSVAESRPNAARLSEQSDAPGINQFVKRELEQRAPGRNFSNHHVIELVSLKPAP
jgi:hypothetical protein